MPDSGASARPGLAVSGVPRFCDAIRMNKAEYSKYFKPVFTNKTFRVYQVLNTNSWSATGLSLLVTLIFPCFISKYSLNTGGNQITINTKNTECWMTCLL